jgi:hypothetical protein
MDQSHSRMMEVTSLKLTECLKVFQEPNENLEEEVDVINLVDFCALP